MLHQGTKVYHESSAGDGDGVDEGQRELSEW